MPDVFETQSALNKQIRLTATQWQHIRQRHPELREEQASILQTLKTPDLVLHSRADETYHYLKWFEHTPVSSKHLLIVAKHQNGDGFVITAFFLGTIRHKGKVIVYER